VLAAQADVVARACASQEAPLVRGVAEKLEAVLAEVLCGFAHGVFLNGNLLVENGRLAGVVDWDTAGLDRPPHVDFLHLGKTSVAAADVAREWLPSEWLPSKA
jgi:aminoglycoside phosphotransferase (APT) family kinase protein